MWRKSTRVLCALFLITAVLFCACTQEGDGVTPDGATGDAGQAASATQLTLPYFENDSLNPYFAASVQNRALAALFCEPLYRVLADYSAQAVLAKEMQLQADTLTVTLQDAVFSNGKAVSGADVVYSFERAKDSAWYQARLAGIRSATARGNTVTFRLGEPDAFAVNLLTFPIVQRGTADAADQVPIGTGAFVLAANGTCTQNTATPRECSVKQVSLFHIQDTEHLGNALEIGNISFLFDDLDKGTYTRLVAQNTFVPMNNLVYLGVNHSAGALQSAAVRTALYYAADKTELAASAYQGCATPTTLPFPPAFCTAQSLTMGEMNANAEKAVEILQKLGYNRYDQNGVLTNGVHALSMTLLCNAENGFRKTAAYTLAQALNAVGFSVTVEIVPAATYASRIATGQFTLYIGEVKLSENLSLSPFFSSGGAAAAGLSTSSPVFSAYAQFRAGTQTAAQFAESFLDDMPFVPLCYRTGMASYSKNLSPDFSAAAYDIYGDITRWQSTES